jgi:hypothetical protein
MSQANGLMGNAFIMWKIDKTRELDNGRMMTLDSMTQAHIIAIVIVVRL